MKSNICTAIAFYGRVEMTTVELELEDEVYESLVALAEAQEMTLEEFVIMAIKDQLS